MKHLHRFDISDNKLKPKDIAYMSLSFCNTGMNFINYANKQEERPYIPIPTYISNTNTMEKTVQKIQKGELNKGKTIEKFDQKNINKNAHSEFIDIINPSNGDNTIYRNNLINYLGLNNSENKFKQYIYNYYNNKDKNNYLPLKSQIVEEYKNNKNKFTKMFINTMVIEYVNQNKNNNNDKDLFNKLKNKLNDFIQNKNNHILLRINDLNNYIKMHYYGENSAEFKNTQNCYNRFKNLIDYNKLTNDNDKKPFSNYYNNNCIQTNNTNPNSGNPQNTNPNSGNSQYNSNLGNLNTPILDEYKYKFNQ